MPTYILLLTLTPEGREKALQDPLAILHAQDSIMVADVHVLGQYAVLGDYDFVSIVEAPDNDTVARFSLELGVRGGAHIATLPTIPLGRLEATAHREPLELEEEVSLSPPRESRGRRRRTE